MVLFITTAVRNSNPTGPNVLLQDGFIKPYNSNNTGLNCTAVPQRGRKGERDDFL
jgi:hypothetical protein